MKKNFSAIKPTPGEKNEIARIANQLVKQVKIDCLNNNDASIEDDSSGKGHRQ